ncbi:helix-turn-helix domain-containing protein [Halovenus salina]|uniref:Helix-turn-helix domain-containing protein n=1 Tax=Halovenus salina TaxID=1510225 RepID=A0ABD5W2C2_9EURY|nr:helix-turn-helix domain-containing protein [Halovenus salina]
MEQVTIQIKDDSAYVSATQDSDAVIELWCNEHCDLLYVVGAADGVVEYVRDQVGVRDDIREGNERVIVTDDCLKQHEEGYIETYVTRHDCLLLPPLRYEDGAKHVRVLALDSQRLTDFFNDINDDLPVDVASTQTVTVPVSGSPLPGLGSFSPDLSPRQREVLSTAWQEGYYEIPREVTTEELAATFDLNRRTVEDHLRRAEQKLVGVFSDSFS